MAAIRPRDLLSDALLSELGRQGALAADIGRLADVGYLIVALPEAQGGLDCTLRQAACGQRRLARHAPGTALAVSAHLYWTGAAADAYRAGDDSVRWLLAEAARGALVAGGHGAAGSDLKFADPKSRCEPDGSGGFLFRDPGALSTTTPSWDWIAVHAVHTGARPRSVIGFAGRGTRCAPAFRAARVCAAGTPGDVFTTSALTWGHAILASVQYSDARRAFNDAITACADAATPAAFAAPPNGAAGPGGPADGPAEPEGPVVPGQGTPGGLPRTAWPLADAGARLDAMKANIAEITHPWALVQEPAPDLGGQHLISLYAMRARITEGAASVHALVEQLTGTKPHALPLVVLWHPR